MILNGWLSNLWSSVDVVRETVTVGYQVLSAVCVFDRIIIMFVQEFGLECMN